mmetsp:Transcript_36850/g.59712  ORF Transcript_36850/g.59712 Transcript_36850/m.59712 type:complete len:881 (-) Transcript_36850:1704-4346(-)
MMDKENELGRMNSAVCDVDVGLCAGLEKLSWGWGDVSMRVAGHVERWVTLRKKCVDEDAFLRQDRELKRVLDEIDGVAGEILECKDVRAIRRFVVDFAKFLVDMNGMLLAHRVDHFELNVRTWKNVANIFVKHYKELAEILEIEPLVAVALRSIEDGVCTLQTGLRTASGATGMRSPVTSAKFTKSNIARLGMLLKLAKKLQTLKHATLGKPKMDNQGGRNDTDSQDSDPGGDCEKSVSFAAQFVSRLVLAVDNLITSRTQAKSSQDVQLCASLDVCIEKLLEMITVTSSWDTPYATIMMDMFIERSPVFSPELLLLWKRFGENFHAMVGTCVDDELASSEPCRLFRKMIEIVAGTHPHELMITSEASIRNVAVGLSCILFRQVGPGNKTCQLISQIVEALMTPSRVVVEWTAAVLRLVLEFSLEKGHDSVLREIFSSITVYACTSLNESWLSRLVDDITGEHDALQDERATRNISLLLAVKSILIRSSAEQVSCYMKLILEALPVSTTISNIFEKRAMEEPKDGFAWECELFGLVEFLQYLPFEPAEICSRNYLRVFQVAAMDCIHVLTTERASKQEKKLSLHVLLSAINGARFFVTKFTAFEVSSILCKISKSIRTVSDMADSNIFQQVPYEICAAISHVEISQRLTISQTSNVVDILIRYIEGGDEDSKSQLVVFVCSVLGRLGRIPSDVVGTAQICAKFNRLSTLMFDLSSNNQSLRLACLDCLQRFVKNLPPQHFAEFIPKKLLEQFGQHIKRRRDIETGEPLDRWISLHADKEIFQPVPCEKRQKLDGTGSEGRYKLLSKAMDIALISSSKQKTPKPGNISKKTGIETETISNKIREIRKEWDTLLELVAATAEDTRAHSNANDQVNKLLGHLR